jgi:heme oxygenase
MTAPAANLRHQLREATAQAHDLLDDAMRAASGWQSQRDYIRFLQLQHAARQPIEDWLECWAPADLKPPCQTALIAQDLADMRAPAPNAGPVFAPTSHSRNAVLGVAWALAGSALGNRSILKEVERTAATGDTLPHTFLADPAMLAFWTQLRRRIERLADGDEVAEASAAASEVFAHFLSHAERAGVPA